jgi:hypothetical protein
LAYSTLDITQEFCQSTLMDLSIEDIRRQTSPDEFAAVNGRPQRAWTNSDELRFLLDMFNKKNAKFLKGYIEAAELRYDWAGLNQRQCVMAAKNYLNDLLRQDPTAAEVEAATRKRGVIL